MEDELQSELAGKEAFVLDITNRIKQEFYQFDHFIEIGELVGVASSGKELVFFLLINRNCSMTNLTLLNCLAKSMN
jgi:hypothetical protein